MSAGALAVALRPTGAACGACRHFSAAPGDIEASIAGLTVMGSGYSAVRASDGICGRHDRYLSATHFCGDFASPAATL